MKNQVVKLGLLAFVFAIAFSCEKKDATAAKEPVSVNTDSIKTAIQEMENAYSKAMEERNIDNIMVYYADDVMSVDNGTEPVSGKENVKKLISEQLATLPANSKITMEANDVLVSNDGEMVSEMGTYIMKDSAGVDVSKGYYNAVFQKRDGKYQCVREMISSTSKKEAPTEIKK